MIKSANKFAAIDRRRGDRKQRCLEICVDSLQSARNAIAGGMLIEAHLEDAPGADRLELCSSLGQGGLTPTVGLLLAVRAHLEARVEQAEVLVFCMIRCRPGDFEYDDDEMNVMLRDVDALKTAGADGFVFGALNWPGLVDVVNCQRVKNAVQELPLTFHRAFDVCADWREALLAIRDLGFKRILTSGQAQKAIDAVDTLANMVIASDDTPIIMVGSGITVENIALLVGGTHAIEFHASASVLVSTTVKNSDIKMGAVEDHSKMVTQTQIVTTLGDCVHDCSV